MNRDALMLSFLASPTRAPRAPASLEPKRHHAPVCPKCGARMYLVTSYKGETALGCDCTERRWCQ